MLGDRDSIPTESKNCSYLGSVQNGSGSHTA
jgi:hypothetical protein